MNKIIYSRSDRLGEREIGCEGGIGEEVNGTELDNE